MMMRYQFYYKGRFYEVHAVTYEAALEKIREEYSAQCSRECFITEVREAS